MSRYAVDAPTLLYLVDSGRRTFAGHQLVAPNRIRGDALQWLYSEVRAGRMTERAALAAHDKLTAVKMRLLGDRVSRRRAWRIARERNWDHLDAAEYLAVALLQADALVTVSPGLAALADGVVALAPVSVLVDGA
jgi:hypothetical protein